MARKQFGWAIPRPQIFRAKLITSSTVWSRKEMTRFHFRIKRQCIMIITGIYALPVHMKTQDRDQSYQGTGNAAYLAVALDFFLDLRIGELAGHSRGSMTMYTHYFYHIEDGAGLEKCESFEAVVEHGVPDINQVLNLNKPLIFRRAV